MDYEILINRIKQRDNSAVMEFYNRFYKDVYYICYKITENEKDAEDVTQETLIKAIEKIDNLKEPEKISAWLKVIANNLSLNYLKKNRKFDIVDNSEDMGEEIFEENRVVKKTPEDVVADKEVADILSKMINNLPREQRITIFMFYYEELSVKEIAEIMDCSEATVRSRINYARKALRKQADDLEDKGVKLRCIASLPFLFTIYNYDKTDVLRRLTMQRIAIVGEGTTNTLQTANVAQPLNAPQMANATGEVVKMSLKAKIAIGVATVAAVAGGIIAAVSFTNNDDDNDITDNRNVTVSEDNDTTTDEITEASTEDDSKEMVNWFKTAKWNTEADGFKTLFTEGIGLPINPEEIENIVGPYDYFTDGYDKKEDKTLQDILNDPTECNREFKIWPSHDENHYNIMHMNFINYKEDEDIKLTAKQIYDEKWWCIFGFPWGLGISEDELPDNGAWGNYEAPVLDVIAEKYGAPSYILILNTDDLESEVAKAWLWYELVYEYDDYVVAIDIQDQPMPEYNAHVLEIQQFIYYTKECWEKELEKEPIGNDTIVNGVTCKFRLEK